MNIPLFNFTDLHNPNFREEILSIFSNIMEKNAFVEGIYNEKFESDFARLQQATHCLLVANGTDALEIALIASGVKPGDKVAVPNITFYATAEAVLNVHAIPVLVDVDPNSGLIDPQSLERMAKQHSIKAAMPVHIYGLPAPINKINEIAQELDFVVIEDAAQASGTFVDGKPVGSHGNLTTFSFYPTKNLSAFGDAGAILTSNEELAEKIKQLRNHGRGSLPIMGRNSRCDHLQAAVLYKKLEKIEQYNKQRKSVASQYHAAFQDSPVKVVDEKFLDCSSWHLYPIHLESSEQRNELQKHLVVRGIGSAPFYEKALSQEEALTSYPTDDENAKALAGKVLCLPMHPFLKKEEIQRVATEVKNFLNCPT